MTHAEDNPHDSANPTHPSCVLVVGGAAFRAALAQRLAADDIRVVGEAPSIVEGARLVQALVPDVAIVQYDIPDEHGLDLIAGFVSTGASTAFVVITAAAGPVIERIQRAGARGVVAVGSCSVTIGDAVRAVIAGERYLDPALRSGGERGEPTRGA